MQGRCVFQAHTTPDHKSYRFNNVREMIHNLISQLKEEALEDAEHKDLCDTELTTNTQARKEKTATVENLHATVNELKTSTENSVVKVTKLFVQVSHQLDEHKDMQGELQLMKDLEMYERILHTDVPSGKKIWSTRRCHRYMGAGVRPDSWSDSPVTQIGKQLFPMYQDSWLCVFFFARYRIHQAAH